MKQIINLGDTVYYSEVEEDYTNLKVGKGKVVAVLSVLSEQNGIVTAYGLDDEHLGDPLQILGEPDRILYKLEDELYFSKDELKQSILEKIESL